MIEADLSNGGSMREIKLKGVQQLTGLAVDWIGNHIYVVDIVTKKIEVITIDGLHQKNLLSYLVKPTDIALDPTAG